MKPDAFVTAYLPFAQETQLATGIHADAVLAQAAYESGWGDHAPGNMFFGVKDLEKGKTGKGQLLLTTEYLKSPDQKNLFPEVLSVTWNEKRKLWKYKVRDWFRKYDTPAECFKDHAQLFVHGQRYATAMTHAHEPIRFLQEVAKAGYATEPSYAQQMTKMVTMIQSVRAKLML